MDKQQLTDALIAHLNKLIDGWFDINTLQDKMTRAIAKTALNANKGKIASLLDLITDDNGNILISDLLSNFGDGNDIQIDLTKISPLLPPKVLIIGKSDIEELINKTRG